MQDPFQNLQSKDEDLTLRKWGQNNFNSYARSNYQSFKSLNSSVSPSKRTLHEKESNKKSHYLNATGPGDYEQTQLTGSSLLESSKKNAPSFSFGSKIQKPSIITKKHVQELLGWDSPGVGLYDTSPKGDTSPKYSMGSGQRFQEKSSVLKIKKQV